MPVLHRMDNGGLSRERLETPRPAVLAPSVPLPSLVQRQRTRSTLARAARPRRRNYRRRGAQAGGGHVGCTSTRVGLPAPAFALHSFQLLRPSEGGADRTGAPAWLLPAIGPLMALHRCIHLWLCLLSIALAAVGS